MKREEVHKEEQDIDVKEEEDGIAALDLVALRSQTLSGAIIVDRIEIDASSYGSYPSFLQH